MGPKLRPPARSSRQVLSGYSLLSSFAFLPTKAFLRSQDLSKMVVSTDASAAGQDFLRAPLQMFCPEVGDQDRKQASAGCQHVSWICVKHAKRDAF